MAPDVVNFKHVQGTVIDVRFSDGCERLVDLVDVVRAEGVFASLKDPAFVASGRVNPDTGTIELPGGGDVSPERLYQSGKLTKSGAAAA